MKKTLLLCNSKISKLENGCLQKSKCQRRILFLENKQSTSYQNVRHNNREKNNSLIRFINKFDSKGRRNKQVNQNSDDQFQNNPSKSVNEKSKKHKNKVLSIQNLKINVNLIKNHRYLLPQELINFHNQFKPLIPPPQEDQNSYRNLPPKYIFSILSSNIFSFLSNSFIFSSKSIQSSKPLPPSILKKYQASLQNYNTLQKCQPLIKPIAMSKVNFHSVYSNFVKI